MHDNDNIVLNGVSECGKVETSSQITCRNTVLNDVSECGKVQASSQITGMKSRCWRTRPVTWGAGGEGEGLGSSSCLPNKPLTDRRPSMARESIHSGGHLGHAVVCIAAIIKTSSLPAEAKMTA